MQNLISKCPPVVFKTGVKEFKKSNYLDERIKFTGFDD